MKRAFTYTDQEGVRLNNRPSFPSIHPDSVLVAPIGDQWEDGCEEALHEMIIHTRTHVDCWMQEMPPIGFPLVNTGGMRDRAALMAKTYNFEWLYIVDNDILHRPDTLIRLIDRGMPVSLPYYTDPNTEEIVGNPKPDPDTGLQRMEWVTFSAMLFRTSVFNCPVKFGTDLCEVDFFLELWNYGHQPFMDTDTPVQLLTPPTKPGDLDWRTRWNRIESGYADRHS